MKSKHIELTMEDVPNVSDVLCICEPRGGGAVTVLANAQGRDCLQKVFPKWITPWEQNAAGMPSDWLHAVFRMPELADHGAHNLPPISGGMPLEEATPAALAFLLAVAATNQGARVMTWDEQRELQFKLYLPPHGSMKTTSLVALLAAALAVLPIAAHATPMRSSA